MFIFELTVPNISSLCKAAERGDAVASLTEANAADGDMGGAVSTIMNVSVHLYGNKLPRSKLRGIRPSFA